MPSEVCIKVANAYRVDRRNEFYDLLFNEVGDALGALKLRTDWRIAGASGEMVGRSAGQEAVVNDWIQYTPSWRYPVSTCWGEITGLYLEGTCGDAYYWNPPAGGVCFTQGVGAGLPSDSAVRSVRIRNAFKWFGGGALSHLPAGTTINDARMKLEGTIEYATHNYYHQSRNPGKTCEIFGHCDSYERIPALPDWDSSGNITLVLVGRTLDNKIRALGWSESVNFASNVPKVINITDPVQKILQYKGKAIYKNLGFMIAAPPGDNWGAVNGDSDIVKGLLPAADLNVLVDVGREYYDFCICSSTCIEFKAAINLSNIDMDFTLPNSMASRRICYPANYPSMEI